MSEHRKFRSSGDAFYCSTCETLPDENGDCEPMLWPCPYAPASEQPERLISEITREDLAGYARLEEELVRVFTEEYALAAGLDYKHPARGHSYRLSAVELASETVDFTYWDGDEDVYVSMPFQFVLDRPTWEAKEPARAEEKRLREESRKAQLRAELEQQERRQLARLKEKYPDA